MFIASRDRRGRYVKGNRIGHRIKKGECVSQETQFKKGHVPANFSGFGVPRISKRGDVVATIDENIVVGVIGRRYFTKKRTTYARVLWTKTHGTIPKGGIIYNIDQENPTDIRIENLVLITRAQLLKINNGIIGIDDILR